MPILFNILNKIRPHSIHVKRKSTTVHSLFCFSKTASPPSYTY